MRLLVISIINLLMLFSLNGQVVDDWREPPVDMDSVRYWERLPVPSFEEMEARAEEITLEPLTLRRGELYFPTMYTWARSVDIDGNLAALACEGWVIMANIQNLTSPTMICAYERFSPNDACHDVKFHGNYLFVTNRVTGLEVYYYYATAGELGLLYTYHRPENMEYRFIEISGDRAFISCKTGLVVLDIKNPSSIPDPIVVLYNPDSSSEACYNKDLAVDGKYVFQACANQGIQVYDFTDFDAGTGPVKRYQILYCPSGSWRNAQDVWVDGDFLYVADWYDGLEVFDITHIEECVPYCAPGGVGEMPWIGHGKVKYYATAVSGSGDWVYVSSRIYTGSVDPCYGYLQVFNCTNPTGDIGIWSLMKDTTGVDQSCVHGNWVIYVSGTAGRARSHMTCQEVAERITTPTLSASLGLPSQPNHFAIAGNYAFITTLKGLAVVNISNPEAPYLINHFYKGLRNTGIDIKGNYAYFNSYDSLYVVDISEPESIDPVTDFNSAPSVPGGENIGEISIYGNYLFTFGQIAGDTTVFIVYKIENPFEPVYVTYLPLIFPAGERLAGQIEIAGDTAYVSLALNCYYGPYALSEESSIGFPTPLETWYSLFVVDISNPESPKLVTRFGAPDTLLASAIVLDGDNLFSLCDNIYHYDLSCWSVVQPAEPILNSYSNFLTGTFRPRPYWITRFGDDCYFSNKYTGGLPVYLDLYYSDITNPSSFTVDTLISYSGEGAYRWGIVAGDYLFAVGLRNSGSFYGLDVYKVNQHPSSAAKRIASRSSSSTNDISIVTTPQPFNRFVKIFVNYPEDDQVEIAIYDVTGRMLKSLSKGYIRKGTYSFLWDGRNSNGEDVSSGIYLVVVKGSRQEKSGKLIYVK